MDWDGLDIDELVWRGLVYSTAIRLSPTGVLAAQAALFNASNTPRVFWVLHVDVSTTAAINIDLAWLQVNPAFANPLTPVSRNPIASASAASVSWQVAAAPSNAGLLGQAQVAPSQNVDYMEKARMRLQLGNGIMVSMPAVAATVSVQFVWAEVAGDL